MILKQATLANLNVSHNIVTIMMTIMMRRQNVSVEKRVLPDLECSEVIPYDISSLDEELRKIIQDSLCSLDMSKISMESSSHADKVMTQLWIYNNRDEWEMDALKKNHGRLFRYDNKYSQDFLSYWKEKYPNK